MLLINRKMPKECNECFALNYDPYEDGGFDTCGLTGKRLPDKGREKDCPLIEVDTEVEVKINKFTL